MSESEPLPKLPGYVVFCNTHLEQGTLYTYGPGGMFDEADAAMAAADQDDESPPCVSRLPQENHNLATVHVSAPR